MTAMQPWSVVVSALVFVVMLFVVAASIDARAQHFARHRARSIAYALSLAVYCTSWTFYGAVGAAATSGWSYLPIYLAPIMVFLIAPNWLRRMAEAVRSEGATTISDFIGARFQRSQGLAALITITAAMGIIPYIALQLRSVGTAFVAATGGGAVAPIMVASALLLGLFALLFGTRHYEAAGRSEGLVFAIALESVIKLLALVAVGIFAIHLLWQAPTARLDAGFARLSDLFAPERISSETAVIMLIAAAAIICLPRQFYMGVVEARSPDDLPRARVPFALYLAIMAAIAIPTTLAGLALLPAGARPDLFVLTLPLAYDHPTLVMVAFIGGLSAATAMVVVETIALATMISNDLIAPVLLRRRALAEGANPGRTLLRVRRTAIGLVIGLALLWGLALAPNQQLASIGHIAFAAMTLFAPLLLMAVSRGGHDPVAAIAGLSAGLVLWFYTLALPPVLPAGVLELLAATPFDPHRLLGLGNMTPLVHGVAWSLGITLLVHAIVAARQVGARAPRLFRNAPVGNITDMGGLADFAARFVGIDRVADAFGEFPRERCIDRMDARRAERLIAGVVGVPSARALMASALVGERLSHDDVARMLDEGGQSLRFSQGLLAATLENIDPGVSVIDRELRLVAWNSRYLELFDYPDRMVRVGAPLADLIRYNAERGECGPGEVDSHVEKRMAHLMRGTPHSFERVRDDGRIIKTVGGPMPGGGYVMCFTDVTAEAQARVALQRSRAELEQRVVERTSELTEANRRLAEATRDKTRFLAAASHDLLQPLHAARLFSAALEREVDASAKPLVDRMDRSIIAAEALLRALLDISKLDAGGIQPKPEPVPLGVFLHEMVEGIRPLAAEKGLRLRLGPANAAVEADPGLLRSIVQNFLSNAIRYTARGGILVGLRRRRRQGQWQIGIHVVDTGAGIPHDKLNVIFNEFERLGTGGEAGIGLGLAIVERSARLIGGEVAVRSRVNRGSAFALWLPAFHCAVEQESALLMASSEPAKPYGPGRRILVVDDDREILAASAALLSGVGHLVRVSSESAGALEVAPNVDIALVDFQLGERSMDGITLIAAIRAAKPGIRTALVTAENSAAPREEAEAAGITVLPKPLDPKVLLSWIDTAEE
jgi:Na+/proline symporter/signal transduction histidine kinase/CheY-like chemotaxis protein